MSLTCFLILTTLVGRTGNILFNVFYASKGKRETNAKKVRNKRKKSARRTRGKCEAHAQSKTSSRGRGEIDLIDAKNKACSAG